MTPTHSLWGYGDTRGPESPEFSTIGFPGDNLHSPETSAGRPHSPWQKALLCLRSTSIRSHEAAKTYFPPFSLSVASPTPYPHVSPTVSFTKSAFSQTPHPVRKGHQSVIDFLLYRAEEAETGEVMCPKLGGGLDRDVNVFLYSWPEFSPTALGGHSITGWSIASEWRLWIKRLHLRLVLWKPLGLENMKLFLCQAGKELFLQTHHHLSHCFPVTAEQISESSNTAATAVTDYKAHVFLPKESIFFKTLFIAFLRAVAGSQQNWWEDTEISRIPRHSLLHYQHPSPEGTFATVDEPAPIRHNHLSP